jgi:hypothetical protein
LRDACDCGELKADFAEFRAERERFGLDDAGLALARITQPE